MISIIPGDESGSLTDLGHRGVSPVLGVALLIAITVILAGVVGFIAIGVNPGSAETPDANFQFEYNSTSDNVTAIHIGGDDVAADQADVIVSEGSGEGGLSVSMTAGDAEIVAWDIDPGAVVRIVWNDPTSDQTTVLAEYTVN